MAGTRFAKEIERELRASLDNKGYVGFHIPRYAFLLKSWTRTSLVLSRKPCSM